MSLRRLILLAVFAAWPAGYEEAAEEGPFMLPVVEGRVIPATAFRPTPFSTAPRINSLSPNRGLIGTAIDVTITGLGLNSTSSVQVTGGGVTADILFSSSTSIVASLSIKPDAPPGNHDVTVVSGGRISNTEAFFAQVPSGLAVAAVTTLPTGTSGDYGCTPAMNFGIKVKVRYQVVDQDGNPISSSHMEPQEEIIDQVINGISSSPIPDWKDIGPSRISGSSRFTSSGGQYLDAPLGICGSVPFRASADQEVSVLVNGQRYPVRAQHLEISSSAQGQGEVSNALDISRSRP